MVKGQQIQKCHLKVHQYLSLFLSLSPLSFPPLIVEILMLLKWRQKEQNLGVVLTNLSHISGEEVVKFLQDTLDCLFEILNTNSDMYGEKVFDVLVSIFGQLQDDKYQHFTTVLDIYITKHFSAVLAYKFLVWCFEKHVREYGHQQEMHLKLEKLFKSMRYLFRFMVQSHSLQVRYVERGCGYGSGLNLICILQGQPKMARIDTEILLYRHKKHEDPAFKAELRQVFTTFSHLMTYQENKVRQVYRVQVSSIINNRHDFIEGFVPNSSFPPPSFVDSVILCTLYYTFLPRLLPAPT